MIYMSMFDTQGEAMTYASRTVASGHCERPYVFMVRPGVSVASNVHRWAIKESGTPGVVMNARIRKAKQTA